MLIISINVVFLFCLEKMLMFVLFNHFILAYGCSTTGHGRSVCVMCALLVELGVAESWKDAEKTIRQKRPLIRMNAQHRKRLEEWYKRRSIGSMTK